MFRSRTRAPMGLVELNDLLHVVSMMSSNDPPHPTPLLHERHMPL